MVVEPNRQLKGCLKKNGNKESYVWYYDIRRKKKKASKIISTFVLLLLLTIFQHTILVGI